MINTWDELDFWQSKEWQDAQEKLDGLDADHKLYNPSRIDLWAALDVCPLERTKVAILGQDPYPSHDHAMGLAFSVPKGIKALPQTALSILSEYSSDLGLEKPAHCDLRPWARQGVLLWNVSPTCEAFPYKSHGDWPEWFILTREIVRTLSERKIVFCFLGAKAREFIPFVDEKTNFIIETAHPSLRAALRSHKPFQGSRIFSRINMHLCEKGLFPINWRL